jgi:hypothetical protein
LPPALASAMAYRALAGHQIAVSTRSGNFAIDGGPRRGGRIADDAGADAAPIRSATATCWRAGRRAVGYHDLAG